MRFLSQIKEFFGFAEVRSSAHVFVEQISQSLRLQPVSIMSQIISVVTLLIYFWQEITPYVLVSWAVAVGITVWLWIKYIRWFNFDRDREANVRLWLNRWMWHTLATGAVWGTAGSVLFTTASGIDQLVVVAILVAVVFASWPAYSCWLPSLTLFTILSLAPMMIGVATAYNVGSAATGGMLIIVTLFVIYSGRCLNDIFLLAVTKNMQNERLVARLKSEKRLAEATRRATQEASERRAKFFAGANHDLRQPLQAMGIYLQILQMQATDENREVINQLDSTAKNISTLVEQLLEVSRIETGHVETKIEDVNVAELVGDLAAEFETVAREKGLILLAHPVNVVISTDPLLVKRILRNLITNAIRYTDRKGAHIVIGARCNRATGKVSIGVYDQGPGIEKEEMGRLFDSFFRGKAGKAGASGFGLGLSIVRGLAHVLSIPVTVGTRLGKGSVFRLEFTAKTGPASIQSSGSLSLISDLDVRGGIALLEDNEIVRNAVAAMMRSWGATVHASGTPSEEFIDSMISQAQNSNLAVVISDYNLGEGVATGLEAIFSIRSGAQKNIPGVLLTAVNEEEIRAAYRRICITSDSGWNQMPVILQKPASPEALASAVRRAVAERRS